VIITPDVVILFIVLYGFGFAIQKCCVKADLLKCYSRMHKTAIDQQIEHIRDERTNSELCLIDGTA